MTGAVLRPAAFLDRDGVLNHDIGYCHRIEDLVWVEGAGAFVALLNRLGYFVFVVTNQSGVARGFYDEPAVHALHAAMGADLARVGARIDAFYHCPHHPDGTVPAYRRECGCRKPAPGLITAALAAWPVDRTRSFLIGDKPSDLAAAAAAGVPGHLFPGGDLLAFGRHLPGLAPHPAPAALAPHPALAATAGGI